MYNDILQAYNAENINNHKKSVAFSPNSHVMSTTTQYPQSH